MRSEEKQHRLQGWMVYLEESTGLLPCIEVVRLCLAEKLCIITADKDRTLNRRSELVSTCRHCQKHLSALFANSTDPTWAMNDNTRASPEVPAKTLHTACSCWHSLDTNYQIQLGASFEVFSTPRTILQHLVCRRGLLASRPSVPLIVFTVWRSLVRET